MRGTVASGLQAALRTCAMFGYWLWTVRLKALLGLDWSLPRAGQVSGEPCDLHYWQSSSMKPLFLNCNRIEAEQQSDARRESSTNLILSILIAEMNPQA